MDDVEHTRVAVTGDEDTDAALVTARVAVHLCADLELENFHWARGFEVNLDCVVDLGVWVRVAHGLAIVGHDVWDAAGAELVGNNFAQLELQGANNKTNNMGSAIDNMSTAAWQRAQTIRETGCPHNIPGSEPTAKESMQCSRH